MSEWVFRRERLGRMVSEGLSRGAIRFLQQHQNLVIVDATDAPGADTGNGHAYFRKSPWTSSDIPATLMFDFEPGERGLEQVEDQQIWAFPSDYIEWLRAAVKIARSK